MISPTLTRQPPIVGLVGVELVHSLFWISILQPVAYELALPWTSKHCHGQNRWQNLKWTWTNHGTCLWINPQNAWAGCVPCHAPPQFFRHCFCFWGRPQGNTVRAGLSFPRYSPDWGYQYPICSICKVRSQSWFS